MNALWVPPQDHSAPRVQRGFSLVQRGFSLVQRGFSLKVSPRTSREGRDPVAENTRGALCLPPNYRFVLAFAGSWLADPQASSEYSPEG